MRSQSPVAAIHRRDRIVITSCIVLITVLAWAYLVHLDRQMVSSSGAGTTMANMAMTANVSWSGRDVFFVFTMWSVMMVGMMSAPAAPVLLLFARTGPARAKGGRLAILLFGLGYLSIWLGFSTFAALAQWALHDAGLLSPSMSASGPRIAGAILIAAGLYQLTPAKNACLTQCQSPLGFLMSNWRDGAKGALEMGARHGLYCLGCCWAIMCVLFAVGVMNLAWVAVLTAFILLEKTGRKGALVARVGGLIIIAFGVVIVAS
ncbi:MAG: DUF2182 domain-containing protein [Gemmatimonadales bacterium]